MGYLRITSKKQSNASLTHLGKVILHCYVVFEMSTKVPEIAQRQNALEKLQASHRVISVEVMQRHPNRGTRTVFATEIDWLNTSETDLSSEEAVLDEDRTIAELAARDERVVFQHTNS